MKKIIILGATLFFTFGAFAGASSYQERVDSWGKSNNNSAISKGFIGDGGGDTTPVGELSVGNGPIGGGLFILSLLAGGYALVNKKRNLKKSE